MRAGDAHERAELAPIAEAIPHLVWTSDLTGSVDYVNDRVESYIGLAKPAAYGWRWVELVHPADAETARRGWQHATAAVTPYELSYRLRRYDGDYQWHVFRALPVHSAEGRITKWLGTANPLDHDVPEDDEGRLVHQSDQFRRLLEAEPVRDLMTDSTGVARAEMSAVQELKPREHEVLRLLAAGHTNSEIADELDVSLRTIEAARARIRTSLGLRTRAEIVRFARSAGFSDVP